LPVLLSALLAVTRATAVERTFAGSAQVDYHFVPSAYKANANLNESGTFDGFTLEAALKLSVDVSDHVSGNVKACFGCHGFELDMAYVDYRPMDELYLRAGRFSPSFGSFNLRHDPGNHQLSDKPLPYDMGRMLRRTAWNNGVLPAPFPDNGVEIGGTHWFGEWLQLDYAAYGVMGFKQKDPTQLDLDFQLNHLPYYVDNNARPTGGARILSTFKLRPTVDLSVGASGMLGTYDPRNDLTYAIVGADASLRFSGTAIRLEYLVRRQTFRTNNPAIFKYEPGTERGDFFVKQGAYLEVEQMVSRDLDLIGRLDGMAHRGNVGLGSELSDDSTVFRQTLGFAYAIERSIRLKNSYELWEFSDRNARGDRTEFGVHLGIVGTL
jgi:hypothetical protein